MPSVKKKIKIKFNNSFLIMDTVSVEERLSNIGLDQT